MVDTIFIVPSEPEEAEPLAKIADKNIFNLKAQFRGSDLNAILCEQGKFLADITGYIHRSLLTLTVYTNSS